MRLEPLEPFAGLDDIVVTASNRAGMIYGHDATVLEELTGFRPKTSVADGVRAFVDWYRGYYRV